MKPSENKIAKDNGVKMHCASYGSMFTTFFTASPVTNLTEAKRCDTKAHAAFFHRMLKHGIYLPPSQFETCFVSAAHTEQDIDTFIAANAQCNHNPNRNPNHNRV